MVTSIITRCGESSKNRVLLERLGLIRQLQLWAWERIPSIRPVRALQVTVPISALGSRWRARYDCSQSPMHVLKVYCDQLTSLTHNQFIWPPYTEDVLEQLPGYCTDGRNNWLLCVYLICWHAVEFHHANCVLRQFGLIQPIPTQLVSRDEYNLLHTGDRRGRSGMDWRVETWEHQSTRQAPTLGSADPYQPSRDYLEWYFRKTVSFIDQPGRPVTATEGFHGDGATAEYLLQAMTQLHVMSDINLDGWPPHCADVIRGMHHVVTRSLQHAIQASRLQHNQPFVHCEEPPPGVRYIDLRIHHQAPPGRQGDRRPRARGQAEHTDLSQPGPSHASPSNCGPSSTEPSQYNMDASDYNAYVTPTSSHPYMSHIDPSHTCTISYALRDSNKEVGYDMEEDMPEGLHMRKNMYLHRRLYHGGHPGPYVFPRVERVESYAGTIGRTAHVIRR